MLLYAVGIVAASLHDALPIFTQQWRTTSSTSTTSEMSQEIFASSGATGLIHGTLTSANSNITQLIALKPAGTPTPTPQPPGGISLLSPYTTLFRSGASSLTVNTPVGTTSGDVMIAHVVVRTAG